MADALRQDKNVGTLTTPLGENVLALARMSATEAISELFEIRIEAVSLQGSLDFASALGLGSVVMIKTQDGQERHFHGLMIEARWAGTREDLYLYQLVLRPWFWLLTRTSDCRIFPNMTPIDIIKKVFSDRGFSDFRDETHGSPPTLEYCVQYRETDYNFVCRLMEEYGVSYFFEHSANQHILVLANAKSSHKPAPGLSKVPYNPLEDGGRRALQYLETWSLGRSAQSGAFVLNDYDYNKPPKDLLAQSEKPGGYARNSMEMYSYPGDYAEKGDGNDLARTKIEAVQSLDKRRSAKGSAASLVAGALVSLERHPEPGENVEYLVTRCWHDFHTVSYRSGSESGSGYAGHYELAPSDRPFRAPLITPKPEIVGVQSALVIKSKDGGPEIDVDKMGRILVQFYWDRKKKPSRRVRVAQIWAGSVRGALFVPRVGDEVLIAYEEGDPDRPIVVGSVYNGDNTVPAPLPAHKTHSGILTRSSTGGHGYNMLMFDDTAGSERIKLRAQNDLMFKALNNEQRDILNDQTENVKGDETITVGSEEKGGNFTLNAFKTATINVGPVVGVPLTQIKMDTSSITLNVGVAGLMSQIVMNGQGITLSVGPGGIFAQIVMGLTGVTISGTPASMLMVNPWGITTVTPTVMLGYGPTIIPLATIGAGTVGPLPLI